MANRITFLGGVGTVTGSKYLVEAGGRRILIDCGLFQGLKQLRLRNWDKFDVPPASIDAVVLTHAHLDHSGYLPVLVRDGFKGPIYCTDPTADLCKILLLDSAYILEKDAEFANRYGFSKHSPALPLYTTRDAQRSLDRFKPVHFLKPTKIASGITATFLPAGHILGASIVTLTLPDGTLAFSGDLGRFNDPTMLDPATVEAADHLVVESTYGNRLHDAVSPADALAAVINRTVQRGGTVLIPTFAVGRVQTILYYLYRLKQDKRIPDVPVFLDSPMAISASDLLCKYLQWHRMDEKHCREICDTARYVNSAEDSKELDVGVMPKIILSASGMLTGGRVLHHLKVFGPDTRSAVVLAGFQAAGTRGAALAAGAEQVKIHGAYVPIKAEVVSVAAMSAHADRNEILRWLSGFHKAPREIFITHGEPVAADALRLAIEERFKWVCKVPEQRDVCELG
jgi:metallo-beta-lactamase family protein